MRPGDLLNLREDLGFFMYGHPASGAARTPGGIMSFDDFTLTDASIDTLRELQKEVYSLLNSAASWGKQINPHSVLKPAWDRTEERTRLIDDFHLPIHHINVGLELRGDLMAVHGSSRDCFLFILYHLVTQEPGTVKRIELCPGCGQIFYKIKRQKYCSQRCSNRTYMQQYRATNGDEISESNHKQYEKRAKAKTGKSVKIGRRPRSK
jgi:hypothetical protein